MITLGSAVCWYTFAMVAGLALLPVLWLAIFKPYLLRRFYEKQGIPFIKECGAPVIGAELQVSRLRERNMTHDWLYTNQPLGLVGTVRGFTIQLYSTGGEMSEKVAQEMGKHIDRNTPAFFSFGRLSPIAIPFIRSSGPHFFERRASLIHALKDMKRVFDISYGRATDMLNELQGQNKPNQLTNMKELVDYWTRETSGELIWGKNNIECSVNILDASGDIVSLPFMTAFNQTSTDLRFYSNRFWNRIYFPLAAWPLTKESRRINYNIKVLRDRMKRMMSNQEEGSVSQLVQQENDAAGIPIDMTFDDLITSTIAGLDSVKSTIMGTLWHIFQEENTMWKEKVVAEIKAALVDPTTTYSTLARGETLSAMIHETMRLEPPGSLINNEVIKNFDLRVGNHSYRLKSGTRIAACIHALHQNEYSWEKDILEKTAPLDTFDPSRFLVHGKDILGSKYFMPFGKGPRRCPGSNVGLLMAKSFITAFLLSNSAYKIVLPDGQTRDVTFFNIYSRASYHVYGDTRKQI